MRVPKRGGSTGRVAVDQKRFAAAQGSWVKHRSMVEAGSSTGSDASRLSVIDTERTERCNGDSIHAITGTVTPRIVSSFSLSYPPRRSEPPISLRSPVYTTTKSDDMTAIDLIAAHGACVTMDGVHRGVSAGNCPYMLHPPTRLRCAACLGRRCYPSRRYVQIANA